MAEWTVTVTPTGVCARSGADEYWLNADDIAPLRDALAEHDPRVGHYEIHHWTVERLDHGDVALFAWSRENDSRPILARYRPSLREWAPQTDLIVWRATLAGLGLRDVE